VSPDRGGAIEEWTVFGLERNLADTLTRRREAYHELALAPAAADAGRAAGDGTPSIHELEAGLTLAEPPAFDQVDRAILQERIVGEEVTLERFTAMEFAPVRSWTDERAEWRLEPGDDAITLDLRLVGLHKRVTFDGSGRLRAEFAWEVPPVADAWFTTELSVSGEVAVEAPDALVWRYPIETVAKSERGFDRTVQGTALVVRWAAERGSGSLTVRAA
jgi:hypothetical protein